MELSNQQRIIQNKADLQKKVNEKRVNEMQSTQTKLREKFIQVNDFMKDCVDKTTRAETQIASELEQQEILTTEIEEIEKDLNDLSEFEEKFKDVIKEFQPYEDVFQEIIKTSDTFQSFDDLMGRCDALSKFPVQCLTTTNYKIVNNVYFKCWHK